MIGLSLLVALLVAAERGQPPTPAVGAEGRCTPQSAGAAALGEAVGLAAEASLVGVVEDALAVWQSCPNYAVDFPRLVALGSMTDSPTATSLPTSVLEVRVVRRNSGSPRCGTFRGRTIVLWLSALTSSGKVRSCGSMALNLAHELGHALGLGDSEDVAACDGTIMADLSSRNLHRRAASVEECRIAGRRWLTNAEWRPQAPRPAAVAPAPSASAAPFLPPARITLEPY